MYGVGAVRNGGREIEPSWGMLRRGRRAAKRGRNKQKKEVRKGGQGRRRRGARDKCPNSAEGQESRGLDWITLLSLTADRS